MPNTSRSGQERQLDEAVCENDLEKAKGILAHANSELPIKSALEKALRWDGAAMTRVLLEYAKKAGISWDMDSEGREPSPVECLFPAFNRGARWLADRTNILPDEERAACARMLVEEFGYDSQHLLYLSMVYADDAVRTVLQNMEITLRAEQMDVLDGKVTLKRLWCSEMRGSKEMIEHLRATVQNWTDEQALRSLVYLAKCAGVRLPIMRYKLYPNERMYSQDVFPALVACSDVGDGRRRWSVAEELLKKDNAEGFARLFERGWMPKEHDRSYLLEMAREKENVSPEMLTVLMHAVSESNDTVSSESELSLDEEQPMEDIRRDWTYRKWDFAGREYEITGYIGADTDVVVPSYINGTPVTHVSSDTFNTGPKRSKAVRAHRRAIERLVIPGTVEQVSWTIWGWHESDGLPNLKEVEYGEGVKEIELDDLRGCPNIERITMPSTLRKAVFLAMPKNVNIVWNGSPDVVIEDGFFFCDFLSDVCEIPAPVSIIGPNAFEGFTNVRFVHLPDTLRRIEDKAFQECKELGLIRLPDGLRTIGKHAFANCQKLEHVEFGPGLTSISAGAFTKCAVSEVSLPSGIKEIEPSTFAKCTQLRTARLPDGLTRIGADAFAGCSSLESVEIPSTVEYIAPTAFANCPKLYPNGRSRSK